MKATNCCIVVSSLLLTLAYSVSAQEPTPTQGSQNEAPKDRQEEAMQRFQRGVALHDEGDYAAALSEFNKAYQLAPSFKLLYQIGQVDYKLKDYAGALKAFERYLAEGGDKIPTERRAQVQEEVNLLKQQVGGLLIVANVFDAQVTVDDIAVGSTPFEAPVMVSVGRRKVVVSAEGRVPATRYVTVAGQETAKVQIDLPRLQGETRTIVQRESKSRMTAWSWVGMGATGALAIGATIVGFRARSCSEDLQDMTYVGTTPSGSIRDQQSTVKRYALATDLLAGAAVVTFGTTLAWTFLRPDDTGAQQLPAPGGPTHGVSIHPVIGLGSVAMRGEF